MTNILIFSPHPDDAEITIGGIIAKHSKKYKITVVDLTMGENSCNGSCKERFKEALVSATILNIKRINLGLRDCEISHLSAFQEKKIIEIVRKLRPSIVIAPYKADEHPDHKETYYLIKNGVYKAGLNIYHELGSDYKCKYIYYYAQELNQSEKSISFDVSSYYDQKLEALSCYRSQFVKSSEDRDSVLNYYTLNKIKAKDSYCGQLIQGEYGEELIYEGKLVVENIFEIENI